jgi:hypothetical protein
MTRKWLPACLALIAVTSPQHSVAGNIWDWSHHAAGSAVANVFDGGPIVFAEENTDSGDGSSLLHGASDSTMPGALGAGASGTFSSRVFEPTDDLFRIAVRLSASYSGSLFPGGDNPGGMAESELFSIIEFAMPLDTLTWDYRLDIDVESPFAGSAHVLVENVTKSQTLLILGADTNGNINTELSGTIGDRIRITADMSGYGTTPGGSKWYDADLLMRFEVPEPQILVIVLMGIPLVQRSRRFR